MFSRLVALIVKELQAVLQDRQSRMILIMPVLLQVALFPLAATLEVKNNTLAVFNEDSGGESYELIQRFSKAKAFSTLLVLHSEGEVRSVLDNQRALAVIRFSPDFSRNVVAGRPAILQALLDGCRSNSAQIALSYVQQSLQSYTDERLADR